MSPQTQAEGVEIAGSEGAATDDCRAISAELLSAVMSLIPDAAVVVDPDGTIVSINEQAETLFRYDPGTLAGHKVEALVPERARRRHREHRSGFLSAPQSRPMGAGLPLTGRRQDGTEFPLDISLAPIVNAGVPLVVAAIRDVSEQRRSTAAQAELAAIVRSSLDAIIATTLEGAITSWNPAAEELFGYPREEIVGRHLSILVPDFASLVLEEMLEAATEGMHLGARDTRWRHRDGHELDVAVSISPLKDETGGLLGYSSLVRDIAERKAAEQELHRLLAEEARLQRLHAATSEIRLALLSDLSLAESLELICRRSAELIEVPVAVITVKDGDRLRVAGAVGSAEMLGDSVFPARDSLAGKVIERGEPVETARRSDLSRNQPPPGLPDGPMFGVPILIGGVAQAALSFVHETGGTFDPGVRMFAEALAAQAALAFELDRSRVQREEMMLVGDRERIARDLHDHVIQRLFATGIGLQSTLSNIDSPRAQLKVSEAVDTLDATIREIRSTIFALAGAEGGNRLVRSQVMRLAGEARQTLGFEPSIGFDGPVDAGIPDHVVPHVLACVREALSNAARHSHATSVRVQLVVAAGTLLVTVTDNGIGIGPRTRSSGLANLEERARLLGGSFQISALPEGGTRLTWSAELTP